MGDVNIFENIKEQKRIDIIIILIISIFILGGYVFRLIELISPQPIFELTNDDFVRIFSVILSMLGVLSCLLCYSSNKKEELFIMFLMYTMFFLDICTSNLLNYSHPNLDEYHAIITSFVRVSIVYIAVSNLESLKKLIINNKIKSFLIVSLITFISIYIEYKYMYPYNENIIKFYKGYNIFLAIVYIIIAFRFFKKSFNKKEYIYSVIGSSALMFSIKSIYDFFYIINPTEEIGLTSTSTIFLGFIIFILGLFIELSRSIKINRILDGQRSLFIKIIDENKHSNIIICDENYKIEYKNAKTIENMGKNHYFKDLDIEIGKKFDIAKIYKENLNLKEIEYEMSRYGCYSKDIYIKDIDKILDISIQTFEINNKKYKALSIKDVSEKYELEKALLKYERIKQEEKVKNEFFSNISHELKTPLNIIYSANQLLSVSVEKSNFKEIYIKYKDCLDINCKRMLRLIDNIVDITKLDVGFKCPEFDNYNIVKIVEDMTLSVVSYANVKGIEVLFDTDVEELDIKCDPDMIERIVLNLLSNAIKFSEEGSSILVEIFSNKTWVGIKVKDNGIGIPVEIQDKIFDRFVQGDKSMRRKKEGSGIGLSLVKSLVELMDGKIYLESDGKSGTEFTVLLPNKLITEDEKIVHKDYQVDLQRIKLELSDIYELYHDEYVR
ncbi:sensor histidine kinase [Paraclostridium sordellii]|uniref:sensor histidine kinase n=1 Tax=Paraclostridium sordellii TaxID=1505 RepID=UPI0005DBC0F2|nr:HAMP domain-containing sensor histidine kinase [Paeniclostridium sordellii]CEN25166.1 two-component sensor histidine kinase [[Clostridium] sordellii] [Paeniclostridium sordellii]